MLTFNNHINPVTFDKGDVDSGDDYSVTDDATTSPDNGHTTTTPISDSDLDSSYILSDSGTDYDDYETEVHVGLNDDITIDKVQQYNHIKKLQILTTSTR